MVLVAGYVVLEQKYRSQVSDEAGIAVDADYSRTDLRTRPKLPHKISIDELALPPLTPRQPYVAIAPHPVIRRDFNELNTRGSWANRTLSGTVLLYDGAAAANQNISAELILYQPKPDVIFSGKIHTDATGRFELFLAYELFSTTSLSLHLGHGDGQNVFERYASIHVSQVSLAEGLDLGSLVLLPTSD
ncbi:MAG: hypothetical protein COA70_01135 [Planctomycetota bacterium]|nr:MAG: hypothetical protein COA70_01135 [Planctomycetota bacterium]